MFTVSELARTWRVSHQYVSKLAKKGMPLNSLEGASNWRASYASRRPPTDRKQLQLLEENEDTAKDAGHAKPDTRTRRLLQNCLNGSQPPPDSLEFPLDCVRRAEEGTYILFQQALKERRESKIVAAFRNYNVALEVRLKIEQWYRNEADYRRHLIPMKQVRLLMCKGLNVIISRLVAFPEKVGPACNPEAPAHAMAFLRDECTSVIADIKKSCPEQFLDDVVSPARS
jgi:hypothetical protein